MAGRAIGVDRSTVHRGASSRRHCSLKRPPMKVFQRFP
jgi:hypothetical protein